MGEVGEGCNREEECGMKFSRQWAMPSSDTFSIPIIGEWVKGHCRGKKNIVDPFARNSGIADFRNDLNPKTQAEYHMDAREFLKMMVEKNIKSDVVIFDPPYSPRQISECYSEAGLVANMQDTQSSVLKKECRELINKITDLKSICLSFGWNTVGMGKGWMIEEIKLVSHGGDHNDTICMAEIRTGIQEEMLILDPVVKKE